MTQIPAFTLSLRNWRIKRPTSICFLALWCAFGAQPAGAEWRHGMAMHGAPSETRDFSHFSYVYPQAPIGGILKLAVAGTFDSTNPFIVKGIPAKGLRDFTYESLMARGHDEPFSLYGLIAEAVDFPEDRSSIAFKLRAEAKFSDGKPITIDDVIFSYETLRDQGKPNYRSYYSKVTRVERLDDRSVKFHFSAEADREMPLILGLMAILPRHVFESKKFDATNLDLPLGSGPYVVEEVKPGASITYHRDATYWGWHLPVNKGRFNFERIRFEYFREANSAFEAFKKGLADLREERDPKRWASAYAFPAVKQGHVLLEKLPVRLPAGVSGLVFNTRRPVFSNIKVRQALIYLFDAEWINHNLYNDLYVRTKSIFPRSELAAFTQPASPHERTLLAAHPTAVNADVLEGRPFLPKSDRSGRNRKNRRIALNLLRSAGYSVDAGKMVNTKTGKPLAFEILVLSRQQERLALSFARTAAKSGIDIRIRSVDASQFQARKNEFDFDMIPATWFSSLSPGNEQSFYWSPKGRDKPGARNYMGAQEPAIDTMISELLKVRERRQFVDTARALDRVIMSGAYFIPLFHAETAWIARWKHLQHPNKVPLYGLRIDTWWMEPD
jgi:peptide/nickel transport system substrate-binding protein